MIDYVLGFMFSEDASVVAMIKKTKPAWQNGLLNGVGGKVEPGESPIDAMTREFREETGVQHWDWQERFTMGNVDRFHMTVFRCFSDKVFNVRKMTEEAVEVCNVNFLKEQNLICIPNMSWVLPLVLDREPIGGHILYS